MTARRGAHLAVAMTAAVAAGELIDWVARRGDQVPSSGEGVVVVLGFPGSNAIGRAVQRWRVDMAVRAHGRFSTSHIVFTGGMPRSLQSEAAQMARYGRQLGLTDDEIVLEERSVSTWENILFTAPLVGDARFVVLVSDGMHARRALGYWRQQHPDSSAAVFVDPAFRLLDRVWLKFPATYANSVRSVKDYCTRLSV